MGQVDASPYPWPFDGPLRAENLALIEVGVRRDRSSPGVSVAGALANLSRLRSAVLATGGLVIEIVQRTPYGMIGGPRSEASPRHPAARAEPTAAETMELGEGGGCCVVETWGSDAIGSGRLDTVLRRFGRTQLLFGGLGAEGPLHSTLAAANDRGYECLLVEDACAGSEEAATTGQCGTIQASGGIFGATARTSSVVAALGAGEFG